MSRTPTRGLIVLLPLLLALPHGAFAQTDPSSAVEVLETCLPQFASCAAPPGCDSLVPPGGTVGLRVAARSASGAPLPYAKIRVAPDEKVVWTNGDGEATVALRRDEAASATFDFQVDGSGAVTRRAFTWTNVTATPIVVETAPRPAQDAWVTMKVAREADGEPLPDAILMLFGANGAGWSSGRTGPEGIASIRIGYRGQGEEIFHSMDLHACGLELAAALPATRIAWATSPPPPSEPSTPPPTPPSLRLVATDWSGIIRAEIAGGAPPVAIHWRLGGGAWTQTLPIAIPPGTHVVEAYAQDSQGLRSATVRSDFRADDVPPLISPVAGGWTDCMPLAWRVTDAVSGIRTSTISLSVDDVAAVAEARSGEVHAWLPDGIHRFSLAVEDRAGNRAVSSGAVKCDTKTPVLQPSTIAGEGWHSCAPYSWLAADSGSGLDPSSVTLSMDGERVATQLRDGLVLAEFPEGRHNLSLLVRDHAGHEQTSTVAIACDRQGPSIRLVPIDTIADGTVAAPGRVRVEVDDSHSGVGTVRVRQDDEEWIAAHEIALSGEGAATVWVEAIDHAGHKSTSSFELRVDTVAPATPRVLSIRPNTTMEFPVSDLGSGVASVVVRLKEGTDVPATFLRHNTWSIVVSGSIKDHSAQMVATDRAGNSRVVEVAIAPPIPAGQLPSDGALEEIQAEEGGEVASLRVQSLVVTPLGPKPSDEIRVTGRSQGASAVEVSLVAEDGTRHPMAVKTSDDGTFASTGMVEGPGVYRIEIRIAGEDETFFVHDGGTVEVAAAGKGTVGAKILPGPSVLACALVAVLAAFALRRRG